MKAKKFDREEAVRLYNSGMGVHLVAKQLGVTSSPVWRSLRNLVTMRLQDKQKIDSNKIRDMYLSGLSMPQIAEKTGISNRTVLRNLQKTGVQLRTVGEARSLRAKPDRINSHGYKMMRIGKRKYRLEHRLIAAKALGRPLKKGEVVHHIDCDRTNNNPSNLLICTAEYHNQLHARMKKHPYWSKF